LFVVGGSDGQQALASVEVLDLNERRWLPSQSAAMTCPRANVSLVRAHASSGGGAPVLLALGGFNGKVFMNTIETFVCDSDEWRNWTSRSTPTISESAEPTCDHRSMTPTTPDHENTTTAVKRNNNETLPTTNGCHWWCRFLPLLDNAFIANIWCPSPTYTDHKWFLLSKLSLRIIILHGISGGCISILRCVYTQIGFALFWFLLLLLLDCASFANYVLSGFFVGRIWSLYIFLKMAVTKLKNTCISFCEFILIRIYIASLRFTIAFRNSFPSFCVGQICAPGFVVF